MGVKQARPGLEALKCRPGPPLPRLPTTCFTSSRMLVLSGRTSSGTLLFHLGRSYVASGHQCKKHGIESPYRLFVNNSVCPACRYELHGKDRAVSRHSYSALNCPAVSWRHIAMMEGDKFDTDIEDEKQRHYYCDRGVGTQAAAWPLKPCGPSPE